MKRVWQCVEIGFALVALSIVVAFLVFAFKGYHEGPAAWFQAVGAIATVIGAYWVARIQIVADQKSRADEKVDDQARVLLALQHLANEAGRLITLSMYERDSGNQVYADAAAEFDAIGKMISELPIALVASTGDVQSLLILRRVALEMSMILRSDTQLEGPQFVLRYRTRSHELTKLARGASVELASRLKTFAGGRFADQVYTKL
jgi:hypothetical protein